MSVWRVKNRLARAAVGALLLGLATGAVEVARAQAGGGMMSDGEIDSLRGAAYIPTDSIATYEEILDTREKEIDGLLAKGSYPGRAQDLHDLMDQMSAIADELTDHLDSYDSQHRDLRKALPKLVQETERWSVALRAPADDSTYKIVQRIALDSIKNTHDGATQIEAEQEAYFKAHPDAAKEEKERARHPHSPS